jgi:Tfp pilus assembly protein PilF
MRSTRLHLLLLVVLGLVVYANSLSAPFIWDDFGSITENPDVRSLWPLGRALSSPGGQTVDGRPVVSLSLAVNYAVGGYAVRGYHVFNLVLHVLSALLLYGIVRRTLGGPRLRDRYGPAADGLALAAAALWTVHPLLTEAVVYVIQRTELLMAFFYLLTLWCVIRGAAAARPGLWYAGAVVACALGMGSKEVMVSAPLVVLLYDRIFLAPSLGQALRRRAGLYLGLAATWAVLVGLAVRDGRFTIHVTQVSDLSPIAYATTQLGVVAHYLRLAFWPRPLMLDYEWPIASGLRAVAWPGALLAVLGVATLWALVRRPALGFLGVVFFVLLAPSSSFVPIPTEVAAERRMYLPLAAVVVLAVVVGWTLLRRWPRVAAALAAVLVLALGRETLLRNRDYRSEAAIWATVVAARPESPRANQNLAAALWKAGKYRESMPFFTVAVRAHPGAAEAHFNLANDLYRQQKFEEAAMHYTIAVLAMPGFARGHTNLGSALLGMGRLDEAEEQFAEAVRLDPNDANARGNLRIVRAWLGKPDPGDAVAPPSQR